MLDDFLTSIGATQVKETPKQGSDIPAPTMEQKADPFLDNIGAVEVSSVKFDEKDKKPSQTVYLADENKTLRFDGDTGDSEISYEVDKYYSSKEKNVFQKAKKEVFDSTIPIIKNLIPAQVFKSASEEAPEYVNITKERWRKGYEQPVSGMNWGQVMMMEKSVEQGKKDDARIAEEYAQYDVKDYDWRKDPLKHLWGKGVEMAPFMWKSTVEGARGAMEGATAGAIAGVMVGGLDPSDVGFVALGAKVGAIYRTLDYTMRVEGGSVMGDLIKEDVPEGTARAVAIPAGLISGGIELLQLDLLVTSPIRRILAKKIIQNPTVKKAITMGIKNYLKTYFTEIGEEGLQKMTTETFKTLGLYVDGKIPADEMDAESIAKRILKDIPRELGEAAQGMVFMPMGGAIQVSANEISQAKKAKKTVGENRAEVIKERDDLEDALDNAEIAVEDIMEEADKAQNEMPQEDKKYNEVDGKPVEVDVPAEDTLVKEAKKYDSAEDFYQRFSGEARKELTKRGIRGKGEIKKFWEESMGSVEKKEPTLDDLNPTGGVLVDYAPQDRATIKLGKNITTLDKTSNKDADTAVTIYRGAIKGQKDIVAGDFVTTNKELAKSYSGEGNILEKEVKMKDVLDDSTEPLGEEYIYRPSREKAEKKATTKTDKQGFSTHYEKIKKRFGFDDDAVAYDKITHKEEHKKAFDYAQTKPESAMRIAYGVEEAPSSVSVEAIRAVVIESLIADGKQAQAEDVARRGAKEFSKTAQKLGLAKLTTTPESKARHNITKKRIDAIGAKLGDVKNPDVAVEKKVKSESKKYAKEVQSEMSKQETTIEEIDSLIEELIC